MKAHHSPGYICVKVKRKASKGNVTEMEELQTQLYEVAETPESRGILPQSLMLKVPERLFISALDGRLASSSWPSPSLPLFIEQPRYTPNDTGKGTVERGEGVQKSEMELVSCDVLHCKLSSYLFGE